MRCLLSAPRFRHRGRTVPDRRWSMEMWTHCPPDSTQSPDCSATITIIRWIQTIDLWKIQLWASESPWKLLFSWLDQTLNEAPVSPVLVCQYPDPRVPTPIWAQPALGVLPLDRMCPRSRKLLRIVCSPRVHPTTHPRKLTELWNS